MNDAIEIRCRECTVVGIDRAIVVPEQALTEPGYIKTKTTGDNAHAKHEFQAMAEMAYFQFQDDELDISAVQSPIQVQQQDDVEELDSGMIIYRDATGDFHVIIHQLLNKKRMLEATNRYCTRWVRLDI